MSEHPVMTEFREMLRERAPNFLKLAIHFNWDEGPYAKDMAQFNKRLNEIKERLDKTVWGDKHSQFLLKEELIELLPGLEKLYVILTAHLTKEDWESFKQSQAVCKICSKPDCLGIGRPGARDGKRCSGTIETECYPRPVEEERLEEIVEYQLECMYSGKEALPINPRLLLSIIKELRELRHGR